MIMEDYDDSEFVASEHDRLVSAITKLDKTQHITEPTRNEPTNQNSEFNLIKWSNKLKLDNVIKVLEDTAKNVKVSKKLKKSQDAKKVLPKPLEKPQAERIKRATGYEQTKKKVGRWDSVVARNRTVDYVTFPIKTFSTKLQPTDDFLSKLKLKSPLEKELEEIDPQPELEEQEDEQIYPMSYEEMLEHRQNLAKFRAQQSYKAAKAKRQSKIKSKKYHRILKKEKLKQQLKEFEELQSKDPEQALKKLEELEKARALERHTLRHKNTGKWAKSKLVRAKYDKEVRQELAEQLSVSRGLTQKVQNVESSDDEADDENIPDITLDQDPMNPWMMKRSDKTNIDSEFDFGYKKYLKDKMYKHKENTDSETDEENEEINNQPHVSLANLRESVQKLSNTSNYKSVAKEIPVNGNSEKNNKEEPTQNENSVQVKTKKKPKPIATSDWAVESIDSSILNKKHVTKSVDVAFNHFESKVAGKVEKKIKKLKKQISKLENEPNERRFKKEKKDKDTDNLEYLKFKNNKAKPIIDEELIETHKGAMANIKISTSNINLNMDEIPPEDNNDMNIDPSRFIEVKPKYLNTPVSREENGIDDLDDEEQVVPKVDIEEVFEEDDVVASFRQEKEDEINKDIPQDVDLTLPGWGSWGGKGVKPTKRRKNRFITNAPPKMPRRDENKGDIIINETKNPKLSVHKVSDVPFPFTSIKEYEASIRTPLGNTFIPETAHKKLIRPSVITKAGTVIDPMDEDELLVKRNLRFKNESVIKLLAKK